MQRVLVTGGAGFIGSHLCDALIARGCEVMAFDCLHPQVHPASPDWPRWRVPGRDGEEHPWCEQPGLHCWFGDVRDRAALIQALTDFHPDTVIHLAARVGVGQGNDRIADYTSANVTGTAVLMNLIVEYNRAVREREEALRLVDEPTEVQRQWFEGKDGAPVQETQEEADARFRAWQAETRALIQTYPSQVVERVFVAGSMSSYGEGPVLCRVSAEGDERKMVRGLRIPSRMARGEFGYWQDDATPAAIPEDYPLNPASVYAWSKAEQERLALLVGQIHGIDVRVGRFFNVYGERQALGNPYTGVAAIFAARALAGLPPRVYEDGEQARDFIHVSDLCAGILAIMDRGRRAGVYNIGTGEPRTVGWLAQTIADALEAPEPEITGQYRIGDIRCAYADTAALRSLGWQPKMHIADGIRGLIEWVRQCSPEDRAALDRAHNELQASGLLLGGAQD